MMDNNNLKAFLSNNPVMILFLCACPALAATTNVIAGLVMAASVLCILVLSSLVMSLVDKAASAFVRLPMSVIVTAGFASMANMVVAAFVPGASSMLGVYIALCAINAMVALKGAAACDNGVGESLKSALVCGLEFALLVVVMAAVREVVGLGSFAGIKLGFMSTLVVPAIAKAPGAFIVFSVLLAVSNCFKKEAE